MATHSQNISNLENAVYGEQVRRSMIELFEEDYKLVKQGINFGTDVDSPTSSIANYYDGNLYINSDTMDIWEMDGYGWSKVGNIKSISDITTVESSADDGLNSITITLTDGTTKSFNVKNGSKGTTGYAVTGAVDNGDGTFYLTISDGTRTADIATIKGDQGIQGIQGIQGPTGKGVTSITSIDAGKNHTLVANFTDGTSNNITTLRDGTDGTGSGDMTKATYDVNDNGIVDYAEAIKDNLGNTLTYAQIDNKAEKATTLAGYGITDAVKTPSTSGTAGNALVLDTDGQTVKWGDASSLVKSVKTTEFDVSSAGQLSLNSSITNKIGNSETHIANSVFASENGIHGLRYNTDEDALQVYDTVEKDWVNCGGGSPTSATITLTTTTFEDNTPVTCLGGGATTPLTSKFTSGTCSFKVKATGNYSITATSTDASHTKTITVTVDALGTVVTKPLNYDTYTVSNWLAQAGITSSATTFSAVDEKDLRKAMTVHESADYLYKWYDEHDASVLDDLVACAKAIKWLGLRDYVCDKFMANATAKAKLLGCDNWEYILKDKVPVMTSDSAPYGSAIYSSELTSYSMYAFKAFDGLTTTANEWSSNNSSSNDYIGYSFTNPICVKKISLHITQLSYDLKFKIQATNDLNNWGEHEFTPSSGSYVFPTSDATNTKVFEIDNNEYFLHYRIFITQKNRDNATTGRSTVAELQFYGRSLNVSVPKMSTNNTTPYGEAIDINNTTSQFAPYKAFDKTNSTSSSDSDFWWISSSNTGYWLGYDFGKKVKVQKIMVRPFNAGVNSASAYTKKATNIVVEYFDGTQWKSASNSTITISVANGINENYVDVDNSAIASKWRIKFTDEGNLSYYGNVVTIGNLDFYGLDYSERDFATGNKINFLYDHGVEVEGQTLLSDISKGTVTKGANSIKMSNNGTDNFAYLYTNVDFSTQEYNLIRCGFTNASTSHSGGVFGAVGYMDTPTYGAQFKGGNSIYSYDLPNNANFNCSAVRNSTYPMIALPNGASQSLEVIEWWLEK